MGMRHLKATLSGSMAAGDLIRYLQGFPEDAHVRIIAAEPKVRKWREIASYGCITDMGTPVLIAEIDGEEDFNENEYFGMEEPEDFE